MSKVEAILSQLKDIAANPKKAMDDYKAETGKGAVGIMPIYAPEEMVHATGYLPMGIWGAQGKTISKARTYLPPFACSIMQQVMELPVSYTRLDVYKRQLLALCFFLLLGYLGKLVIVDRAEISGNSYNIRLRNDEEGIQRGDILDRNGEVLATSTLQEDGSYLREYPRGRMAAHVTGYSSVGKTGVEAAYNFELMSVHQELLQRLSGLLEGKDPKGNDVVLTLDVYKRQTKQLVKQRLRRVADISSVIPSLLRAKYQNIYPVNCPK